MCGYAFHINKEPMDIVKVSQQRYSAKAYDPARQVPEEIMQQIYEVVRNSPSSVNSQPWHFIVASTPEGKARLAKGVQGGYAFNEAKVRDASHVILFCTVRGYSANSRKHFTNLHRYTYKDLPQWYEKQVYIALGNAMLAAAALGVDSTPMEGIDVGALDAELGLHEQGLSSLVMLSLGYHADGDFNAKLPKSRLAQEDLFTFL